MLEELHVAGLALIDEAWIEFGPGMTVLTGETGAGKTALVGALKLLVGERADSGMVRAGASEALVEGRFVIDGREIVARRRLTSDGRSRCALDGQMATVTALGETLGHLVDLHGQHEHQSLLRVAQHAGHLDRAAGPAAVTAREAYRAAREAYRAATAEHALLEAHLAETRTASDYLRFVADEIESVDPAEGEDEALAARLPALVHADRLAAASAACYEALKGEAGASEALSAALAAVQRAGGLDPALDAHSERLGALIAECDDLGLEVRGYAERIEHDPAVLDEVQARRAALAGLMKKYGPSLAEVRTVRDEARARLRMLDAGEGGLAASCELVAQARDALERSARMLASVREAHVATFTEALGAAVAELAMAEARFAIDLEPLPFESWGPDGPQRIEFLFAPGAGEAPRPLAKIASGGEISRVMLALKSVLGKADDVPVLVFDEVDAGIGGATALAVGSRLARLAANHQVLVVTHLAQVAAFADHHLVVRKEDVDGRTVTRVVRVDGEARIAEVARMLAGDDGETSRAHAAELLGQARAQRGAA